MVRSVTKTSTYGRSKSTTQSCLRRRIYVRLTLLLLGAQCVRSDPYSRFRIYCSRISSSKAWRANLCQQMAYSLSPERWEQVSSWNLEMKRAWTGILKDFKFKKHRTCVTRVHIKSKDRPYELYELKAMGHTERQCHVWPCEDAFAILLPNHNSTKLKEFKDNY